MPQRLTAAGEPPAHCPFCGEPRAARAVQPDDECTRCAAPLYPARRRRLDYSGQRMLRRIAREHPVSITPAWPATGDLPGQMLDLSLNGMRLATSAPLEPNQIVKVDAGLCQALARIAHCRKQTAASYVVGLEFLTLRFTSPTGTFVSTSA